MLGAGAWLAAASLNAGAGLATARATARTTGSASSRTSADSVRYTATAIAS
jgi:hypothetical protein